MRRSSAAVLGLLVSLGLGCRQPPPSEVPHEPSDASQPAAPEPEPAAPEPAAPEPEPAAPEVGETEEDTPGEQDWADDDWGEDEEDREGWVALPEDIPEHPTGVAEIDASVHMQVGGSICLLETSSGDLDGVGPRDWIARFQVCETGEPAESLVYLVGPGELVTELAPPAVGGYGGYPEFDRMHDGERVLLMSDSCCEIESCGIVHLRGAKLVLGDTVEAEYIEVRRDERGWILGLRER